MKAAKECTIFLIDDDVLYLRLLASVIGQLNTIKPILKSFPHSDEALGYLTANSDKAALLPDYIFLDINMPVMDGWQFLTSLGLSKGTIVKKPAIYMLSASDDEQDLEMLKHFPEVKKYLTKPIKKQDLARVFY